MATPPYKIIDRRSSTGYVGANTLIESATQTPDREYVYPVDEDVHRTVSSLGRRTLMTLGRKMFWRFPALQGMVLEQANLAVSSYIPQFKGRNAAWGKEAAEMLTEWYKVMDLAGWPYDRDSYLQGLIIAPLVEGENYTLLSENPDGYPLIQVIPAHRVGKRNQEQTAHVRYSGNSLFIDGVEIDSSRPYPADSAVEFDARIIDGVIVDDYTRAIAYRLDGAGDLPAQDIPARNLFPAFCPIVPGQSRGFSLLASSIFDWQDMAEWKRFELIAQKVFSTRTLIETNEDGEVDTSKAVLKRAATFNADGQKTGLDAQRLFGGTIQYFKAKTGSSVQAFGYDRPGANSREFMNTTLRDAFRGTEWDVFFSLDPQKIGGASMRVVVEKINAVLDKRRRLVKKCCLRVDGYAISKFMQLGLLPFDPEWYKWDYQGPGEVTADKKYDSDVALQEIAAGIGTRKQECARRGLELQDVETQQFNEADTFLTNAATLAKKHNITIQEAMVALRQPLNSGSTVSTSILPEDPNAPASASGGTPP